MQSKSADTPCTAMEMNRLALQEQSSETHSNGSKLSRNAGAKQRYARQEQGYEKTCRGVAMRGWAKAESRTAAQEQGREEKRSARARQRDDWQWLRIERQSEDTQSKSMAANRMATRERSKDMPGKSNARSR